MFSNIQWNVFYATHHSLKFDNACLNNTLLTDFKAVTFQLPNLKKIIKITSILSALLYPGGSL